MVLLWRHSHSQKQRNPGSGIRDPGSGFGLSALLSGSSGLVDGLEFGGLEFRAWGSGVLKFEDPGSRIRVLVDGLGLVVKCHILMRCKLVDV